MSHARRASRAVCASATLRSLPTAFAAARSASRPAMAVSSWAAAPSARARVSGFPRVQTAWSASRTAVSTARSRASTRWTSPRGTLPADSQRSWMSRSAVLAAARSVTGTSFSAAVSSLFLMSRLAANSVSVTAVAASRAAKNASCAPRNRAHSASSSLRLARPAAFHRVISSRYAAAVAPNSPLDDKASASATSASLVARASAFLVSSSAKK